jgi:hypothetical protein
MLIPMHPVACLRFAGLVLAIFLLVGIGPRLSAPDDLSRGKAQFAGFVAIGNEADVLDGQRIARIHSNIPLSGFDSAHFTPGFSRLLDSTYSRAGTRKVYRLKVVFLI